MADAPAPSGSGWGIFEIIIAIVIVVAIANAFNKNGSNQNNPNDVNNINMASTGTNAIGNCIINFSTPTNNQSLTSLQFPIAGNLSNCTLNTPDTALFAQVVESNGQTISDYTTIHTTSTSTNIIGANSFSGNIILTRKPKTKTGQIIIVPNINQDNNTTHTLRIPVTFAIN